MKTLLIAAAAAAGLLTCACTSQTPAAAPPAAAPRATASQPAAPHHHHHHHHPAGGSAQASGSGGAASSGGAATSGTDTASGGASGSGGAAQNTAATPAPCLSRYLGAKVGIGQGTLGSSFVVIVFKNLLNSPCTLYGFPGVSLAGGKPATQIGAAAIENPDTPRQLVTLAPGGKANALLQIVHAADYPASKCGPVNAQWLQIYPPNQTVPIYLGFNYPACSKPVHLLTVNTVIPGSGG